MNLFGSVDSGNAYSFVVAEDYYRILLDIEIKVWLHVAADLKVFLFRNGGFVVKLYQIELRSFDDVQPLVP